MIKAVIIDDELHIRNAIRTKIETYFKDKIVVIGEAESVANATNLINSLKPDLLLLDIELTDGYSFDIIPNIKLENYKIIFITGFDEHAIKAIKLGAIDYLLKPIDDAEFKDAISKVLQTETPKIKEQLAVSNDYYRKKENKRIVLKTLEAYHIIHEDEIIFCKSEGNYTTFYTKSGENIMISKPLKKAFELLSKEKFVRCHQSYLINLDAVEKYLPEGYLVIGKNNIPIASRRKEMVLTRLANM